MLFCRDGEALRRAFAVTTSYMPSAAAEEPYASTVQWSRRAIGLKVLLALAESGMEGAGALFDHQARMGDLLRQRLGASGWKILNETPLPVVCFTHLDLLEGRGTPGAVVAEVVGRGRAWISEVLLAGRERALRACITSFRTEEPDLDVLLEELERARFRARSG
jgi:glutamate/tyrosine decarboxylase-like PLP-dependent enzyme